MMQSASLPVLPHVDATIAGYYQGRDTFVPFRLFCSPRLVYVVCLGVNAQREFQLFYHLDAQTGRPVVCADMREARRVCKQLNQQGGTSAYEVDGSQCGSARGGDGWPLDL